MPFDPQRQKEVVLGRHGYSFSLQGNFEEYRAMGGLASCAGADMTMALKCILVGVDDPAQKILEQANRWLKVAIAEDERPKHYGPDGTEALRSLDLAICEWLLHARHDADSLAKYVEHKDRFLERMKCGKNRAELSLSIAGYLDAGAFARALELFEAVNGKAPDTPGKARSELQMAYVLSKHELEHTYSGDEVLQATKSFLSRNIDHWLTDGQYVTAAHWLKILHWNSTDRTAKSKEIVMKCYDYLPGRTPPE